VGWFERLPRTFAALRQGQINWQQVSVICRAMEEVTKTKLDPAQVEEALVSAAEQVDAQTLLMHWQRMRYQGDQEAGLESEEEQRRRRWLHLWQTWKGSYRLEGELDSEGGTALKTALQGLMKKQPKDDERTPIFHRGPHEACFVGWFSAASTPSWRWPGAAWTRAICPSRAARSHT
jgi:Domain of unknown function (DUF222)